MESKKFTTLPAKNDILPFFDFWLSHMGRAGVEKIDIVAGKKLHFAVF
jgi:hypothetical protein